MAKYYVEDSNGRQLIIDKPTQKEAVEVFVDKYNVIDVLALHINEQGFDGPIFSSDIVFVNTG